MTKKQKQKRFGDFLRLFTAIFTIVLLVISIAGFIYSRLAVTGEEVPKFFDFNNAGLPYSYILALAGISLALTILIFFILHLLTLKINFRFREKGSRYDELFKKHRIPKKSR